MIKLKTPHTITKGTQAFTGTLKVEVVDFKFTKTHLIVNIEDRLQTPEGVIHFVADRVKQLPIQDYLNASTALNIQGLNEVDTIWEVIRISSLQMMQTDLFADGKTSYGKLPNDWEYSQNLIS